MPRYDACLVDVYETVLRVDNARHGARIAGRIGVSPADFAAAARSWGDPISDGRATLAEALGEIMRGCGLDPTADEVAGLVALDGELLDGLVEVFDDTVPFLESLRAAGVRTAFVSNCAENTRPMLDRLGLTGLVDELVMSCEVRSAKPAPEIYRVALDRLGVPAERALFVDDQASYCAGATALGITAVRIDRAGGGDVASLAAVAAFDT